MQIRSCALMNALAAASCMAAGGTAAAPQDEAPEVTLELIMAHPDWIGNAPEDPFWSADGRTVYFRRKRSGEPIEDLFAVEPDGGGLRRVPPEERSRVTWPNGDLSPDRTRRLYVHGGDVFLQDVASGSVRQITRTAEAESRPRFLADGERLAFRRGSSDFVFELASGLTLQPVDLRSGADPDDDESDLDYLEAKHRRLYGALAEAEHDEALQRDHEREERLADPSRTAPPWYLGEGVHVVERSLSPDARWMVVVTSTREGDGGRRGTMPSYVTASGYVETRAVRQRVGRREARDHAVALLDLVRRERHELDLGQLPGIGDDPLAELRTQAVEWHVERGADRDEVEGRLEAPERRSVTVEDIRWSDDGARVALRVDSEDNKDRWLATVEVASPALVTQHRLSDPAWINYRFNELGWLPDGHTLWYVSEEDGYAHLYTQAVGGERRRLTDGAYVVRSPRLSHGRRHLYYRANASHPADYEVYRVDVQTGEVEQLTSLGGLNEFRLSPDDSRLLVRHSELDRPPELYVQPAQPGAEAVRITHTTSEEFLAIDWVRPEIVTLPSERAGAALHARLYSPVSEEPERGAPAVLFVHGAGYLQNAHRGWSYYFREFLFHTLLARRGYYVLDVDYRGSAGYGRDWRTAIYRQMGHPELEDLGDGAQWLVDEHGVDPDRIGIYGGSYGGFLTLMALFREPERFAAGAALRPVTDWAHYSHGYTSNILNTPEVDPMAYERSSPIEYAEHLSAPLLLAAGMQDDNVFFQDTVLLVQRLIELEKEDFETAIYPLERHSFTRPESWLDEYRRILELFERHVRRAVP